MPQDQRLLENLLLPPKEARNISTPIEFPETINQGARGFFGGPQEPGIADDLGAIASILPPAIFGKLGKLGKVLMGRLSKTPHIPPSAAEGIAGKVILPENMGSQVDPRIGTGGAKPPTRVGPERIEPEDATYKIMMEREAKKNTGGSGGPQAASGKDIRRNHYTPSSSPQAMHVADGLNPLIPATHSGSSTTTPIHDPMALLQLKQERYGKNFYSTHDQAKEAARLMTGLLDQTSAGRDISAVANRYPRFFGQQVRQLSTGDSAANNMILNGHPHAHGDHESMLGYLLRNKSLKESNEVTPLTSHSSVINVTDAGDVKGTIAHELLHGKDQRKLGSLFDVDYVRKNDTFGYENNPYEIRANRQAHNTVNKLTFPNATRRGRLELRFANMFPDANNHKLPFEIRGLAQDARRNAVDTFMGKKVNPYDDAPIEEVKRRLIEMADKANAKMGLRNADADLIEELARNFPNETVAELEKRARYIKTGK
jgi:hypothetical protein